MSVTLVKGDGSQSANILPKTKPSQALKIKNPDDKALADTTTTLDPEKIAATESKLLNTAANIKGNTEGGSNGNSNENSVGNVSVKPRMLKSFKAEYPESALKAHIEGPVKLSVLIDPNGHVQDVSVIEGPGYGLNETAEQALKKFIFTPAEKDGEKVAVRIVYVYRFRLESR